MWSVLAVLRVVGGVEGSVLAGMKSDKEGPLRRFQDLLDTILTCNS